MNILRSHQDPPFGWFYKWTSLNEDGVPGLDLDTALKQPETIRIKWDVPEPGTRGRTREVSADIIPDKAILGAEYALIHTIPDFEGKIRPRLDIHDVDFVAKLHDLFGRCLQGKAVTKWNTVLTEYPIEDRTVDSFKEAQQKYLERVADVKNLGDILIRQLRNNKKPAAVKLEEYLARRQEWDHHLDSGYLRFTLARATAQEKAEQIFEHQPNSHRTKYTKKPMTLRTTSTNSSLSLSVATRSISPMVPTKPS